MFAPPLGVVVALVLGARNEGWRTLGNALTDPLALAVIVSVVGLCYLGGYALLELGLAVRRQSVNAREIRITPIGIERDDGERYERFRFVDIQRMRVLEDRHGHTLRIHLFLSHARPIIGGFDNMDHLFASLANNLPDKVPVERQTRYINWADLRIALPLVAGAALVMLIAVAAGLGGLLLALAGVLVAGAGLVYIVLRPYSRRVGGHHQQSETAGGVILVMFGLLLPVIPLAVMAWRFLRAVW